MKFGTGLARAMVLLVFAAVLQACTAGSNSFGDSGTKQMNQGEFAQVAQPKPVAALNQSAAASVDKIFAKASGPGSNPQDYKIGALDVLDISVLGVQDLNRSVQVNSGGTITLPLIRQVQAAGRTQAEMERDIAARLSQTYLQNPQVTVAVKEYNSQRITVDGAVQKPGIFSKQGDMSLLQAIAQAQGLTNYADPTGILVFRMVNNKRMAARFDIRQVRSGKQPDPMLLAGDIVMVDENSTKTTLRDISAAMPLTGLFSVVPLL
ncbi:MAG: polysaccharide export protein [Alphaproteobacteria bacterium]|nr:polysaccharide export protein [Alphaproteobacteria bacterium]